LALSRIVSETWPPLDWILKYQKKRGIGALNIVFIFITMALIPETKNVSLEHIEANLMAGKPLKSIGEE